MLQRGFHSKRPLFPEGHSLIGTHAGLVRQLAYRVIIGACCHKSGLKGMDPDARNFVALLMQLQGGHSRLLLPRILNNRSNREQSKHNTPILD